jgi:hypothetical protein
MTRNAVERLASGSWLGIEFTVSVSSCTCINLRDLAAKGVDTVATIALQTEFFIVTTTGAATPVMFDGTARSLVGQLLAHSCTGALATLRKATCGALAFRCSTELTDFLADLDAADDEKRTDAQHQLHTQPFAVTTSGTTTPVVFDGTVQWLHGKLLGHSCTGAIGLLRNGTCGKLTFKCSPTLTAFLADLDAANDDDEARTNAQHQLHTARFTATTTGTTTPVVFDGTVPSLVGKLLCHSCVGTAGFLRKGVCHSQELKFSLKFKCSPELTNFLQKVSKVQASGEEWSEIQEQLHGMPFSVAIDNAAQTRLTATIAVLQGAIPAALNTAYRTQHYVYHEPEVWAQVAKTSHGLGVTSTSYKLGYTDGANADRDMKAIELAAKQLQEVDKAKSDPQRKVLVGKALGIKNGSGSYRAGSFKQQWIAFLKPTAK